MGNCIAAPKKEQQQEKTVQPKQTTQQTETATKVETKTEVKTETKPEETKKVEDKKAETKPVTDAPKTEQKTDAKADDRSKQFVFPDQPLPQGEGILDDEKHQDYLKKGREELFAGSDCNKKAAAAYESGDKAGAATIRDQGKVHFKQSDEYQKLVSISQCLKAQESDKPEIDLHGYFLEPAMACIYASFKYLQEKKNPEATTYLIIPGAGTHSDEKGPKIKPALFKFFEDNGIVYKEETHGSYSMDIAEINKVK